MLHPFLDSLLNGVIRLRGHLLGRSKITMFMFLFMFTTGLTVYRTSVSVALKIIQR